MLVNPWDYDAPGEKREGTKEKQIPRVSIYADELFFSLLTCMIALQAHSERTY